MTPESARASNAAARDAGWFGNTFQGGMTEEVRQRISDGMPKSTTEEQVLEIISQGKTMTVEVAKALGRANSTTHALLSRMRARGKVKSEQKVINGTINSVWWLA
jgi:DNA-binding NarL/FixJ family response regulator